MRTTPLALVLALVAACGTEGGPETPRAVLVRLEGSLSRSRGEDRTEVPYEALHLLVGSDRLASRIRIGDLVKTRALTGDSGWVRMGAAVADLRGDELADAIAWRSDLSRFLGSPPGSDWPGPAARPGFEVAVSGRQEFPGGSLPLAFEQSATLDPDVHDDLPLRETLSLRFVEASIAGAGAVPLSFSRPEDDPADSILGEPERTRTRPTDVLAVIHRGPLTDLAQVDVYLEESMRRSLCRRRGPNSRTFLSWPDAEGVATVKTTVPVAVSHDPGAENLPSGVRVERLSGQDVLEADLTGPCPRDDRIEQELRARAEAEGLTLVGPLRYLVLSDPNEGEPRDLRQRVRVAVREKE